ncbi:hypothetical protein BS78_K060600 [Paspalum vaginatum]|uniref:Uncharacterized protein n=1 Tax=Paspalum vaginatum TaxID=158149 RepID=A0A9W7XDC9_9POAL|nr:hypothetical protein BS78_K060600 [Paspalum vaginatum]
MSHNECKDSVQPNAMSKTKAELSGGDVVTEKLEDPKPEVKKGGSVTTATDEFNFWGSGFDSDFEVNPLPEMCASPKIDPASVLLSKRKRARSLNEAAYDAFISRKKKAEQGSSTNVSYHPRGELDHHNSTENSNQGCEKHAEIVDSKEPRHIDGEDGHAELQRSSVSLEKSPWEIPDEDILSLIALEEKMQSTPSTQSRFCYNFSSTLIEKEVFKDIIDRIPFDAPSPRVVQIKKNWIDHKTFGLSMRVFGKVSKYAIDIMGQALTAG